MLLMVMWQERSIKVTDVTFASNSCPNYSSTFVPIVLPVLSQLFFRPCELGFFSATNFGAVLDQVTDRLSTGRYTVISYSSVIFVFLSPKLSWDLNPEFCGLSPILLGFCACINLRSGWALGSYVRINHGWIGEP